MKSRKIRRQFLDFFEDRGHRVQDSADLLTSDPDLLFNIAGMVPFKPYFLDREDPPAPRVTTAQKCIRTEDIDQVGQTARHLTFFEMLGNFSFGDYFKPDAIEYGWEFLVDEMGLDPDRLWITVFGGDDELEPDTEAESLWRSVDGVTEDRVLRLGREENFWAMGATGPCGPCSEILYDQASTDADPDAVKSMILDGEDRILELWNLVFMEFERTEEGADLQPLPQKNIDTGLGLERLAAVMQGADSNFGTDLFVPLMDDVRDLIDRDFQDAEETARGRVIADHLRASAFLLSEGLLPGNEGRGYVLRRLIRRAHLRGRRLGLEEPFLSNLVPTVIDIMGDHFDELSEKKSDIQDHLTTEEEQFERILDQGLDELDDRIDALRQNDETSMNGRKIFDLYETHGLPIDMTKEVLDEQGIDYDESEIDQARREHEQRSRDEAKQESTTDFDFEGVPETNFTGYDNLHDTAEITALYVGENRERTERIETDTDRTVHVVCDKTPFYAEGGGQSGDRGLLNQNLRISTTVEESGRYLHRLDPSSTSNRSESLEVGQTVELDVDETFRRGNMRHHTATHLLHHALRKKLGDQVMQDGSALDDESLRFDFTYNEAVDQSTLDEIEKQINEWIYEEIPVTTAVMSRDEAEERGALAFFGEHYGQEVRVVEIVDEQTDTLDSREFCGGTHLDNTAEIGVFTITNETAVAAGVRRIEAKAGKFAYEELCDDRDHLRRAADEAGVQQLDRLGDRIGDLRDRIGELEDELERLRQKQGAAEAQSLVDSARRIGDVELVGESYENYETETLKQMTDEIRNMSDTVIVLLASRSDDNVQLLLGIGDGLTDEFDAGEIIGELGSIVGGGGGGRPSFAQAGGSDPDALPEVFDELQSIVEERHAEAAGH